MRSGPGVARTILLFHIISDRPSKQPRMVGSTLGVLLKSPVLVCVFIFSFFITGLVLGPVRK